MVSRDTQGLSFTVEPWVGLGHKLVKPLVGVSHNQVMTWLVLDT